MRDRCRCCSEKLRPVRISSRSGYENVRPVCISSQYGSEYTRSVLDRRRMMSTDERSTARESRYPLS
jgi:hypothetical protein